jgi:hypothetical protein
MRSDVVPGAVFPDYELADHTSEHRELSELQRGDPMVLVLSRGRHDPMIPHVIVPEPGLVIDKIYNGYWYFGRPTMEELRHDLRAVSKKCRPD